MRALLFVLLFVAGSALAHVTTTPIGGGGGGASGIASTCTVETMLDASCNASTLVDNKVVMTSDSCPGRPCQVGGCPGRQQSHALCIYNATDGEWDLVNDLSGSEDQFSFNQMTLCEQFDFCTADANGADCKDDLFAHPVWAYSVEETGTVYTETGGDEVAIDLISLVQTEHNNYALTSVELGVDASGTESDILLRLGTNSAAYTFTWTEPLVVWGRIGGRDGTAFTQAFFIGFNSASRVFSPAGVFDNSNGSIGLGRVDGDTDDTMHVYIEENSGAAVASASTITGEWAAGFSGSDKRWTSFVLMLNPLSTVAEGEPDYIEYHWWYIASDATTTLENEVWTHETGTVDSNTDGTTNLNTTYDQLTPAIAMAGQEAQVIFDFVCWSGQRQF